MVFQPLTDTREIAAYLRRDPDLHLYSLGDLDDFYRPYTTWYGIQEKGKITALALLYRGEHPPVLLALDRNPENLTDLLLDMQPELPETFYAHLSPGLSSVFQDGFQVTSHGTHQKMALRDPAALEGQNPGGIIQLTPTDQGRLREFYQKSYPGNWFNPRMLETGQYYGIEQEGKLVSAAGVHVYSPRYRVAALGNIATHPDYRGQGLASRVTARCCRSLLQEVDHLGLNVLAENLPAGACYRKLGFETIADYGEFTIKKSG